MQFFSHAKFVFEFSRLSLDNSDEHDSANYRRITNQRSLEVTAFQGGQTHPTRFGAMSLHPLRILLFFSRPFSYPPLPSPPSAGHQVQHSSYKVCGILWASPVVFGVESRLRKHFGIFWYEEMCLWFFVGTKCPVEVSEQTYASVQNTLCEWTYLYSRGHTYVYHRPVCKTWVWGIRPSPSPRSYVPSTNPLAANYRR